MVLGMVAWSVAMLLGMQAVPRLIHCENKSMQYTAIFHGCKKVNF